MTSLLLVSTAVATAALCLTGAAHAQTCVTDNDCGSAMVCHSQTSTSCSGSGGTAPACPANMLCPDAGAPITTTPVCTETTMRFCAYKSCNADSDCGDGFVCQPLTRGTCSASSGSASGGTVSSGGDTSSSSGAGGGSGIAVPPVAVDAGATNSCVTTTSFPGTCQPKNTPCATDSDCPFPLTCKDVMTGGGQPIAITMDAGAAVPPPTATSTSTSAKTCQSPGGSGPTAGGGHSDTAPTAYQGADAGASATTKGASTPPVTSGAADTTATQTSTETAAKTGGGGCSVVKNGSASGAWLALLGLLALLARPRRALRHRRDR